MNQKYPEPDEDKAVSGKIDKGLYNSDKSHKEQVGYWPRVFTEIAELMK